MTTNPETIDSAQELALGAGTELADSLQTLDKRLTRVQANLDLGCANLHDLVNSRNSDVRDQLSAIQEGLDELADSLNSVRGSLARALGNVREIEDTLPPSAASSPDQPSPASEEPEVDPKVAAKMKHDEPVTLGGILRALLMADEPGQRL